MIGLCRRDAGPLPTIASLSLGGSRDFLLKHKDDGKRQERFLMEVRTSIHYIKRMFSQCYSRCRSPSQCHA